MFYDQSSLFVLVGLAFIYFLLLVEFVVLAEPPALAEFHLAD
jgi:hypothetical protein